MVETRDKDGGLKWGDFGTFLWENGGMKTNTKLQKAIFVLNPGFPCLFLVSYKMTVEIHSNAAKSSKSIPSPQKFFNFDQETSPFQVICHTRVACHIPHK